MGEAELVGEKISGSGQSPVTQLLATCSTAHKKSMQKAHLAWGNGAGRDYVTDGGSGNGHMGLIESKPKKV